MLLQCVRFLCLVVLGLCLPPCHAAPTVDDSGTDRSVVVERLLRHVVVEADGSYRLRVEDVRRVAARAAIGIHDRTRIDHDPARDQPEAVAGWTQKPDGRRIPAASIRTATHTTVFFADAAPGDLLVLRYAIRRHAARLPGQFDDLVLPQALHHRDFQAVYDLPAGMPLHADAAGFRAVNDTSPPGRRRYRWRYLDGANPRSEPDAVSQIDDGRRLAVSTFDGYPALAAAVRQALAARPGPPPATRAQAGAPARSATLATAIAPDTPARAQALAVWAARTGRDDDERVVLLSSALAAAGIAATPALVNDGAAYTLPNAATLGVLNRLIVAAPELGLYLDPASAHGGMLPAAALGKPVLLLDTGRFAMTPLRQLGQPVAPGTVADALGHLARARDRQRNYVCPAVDAEDRVAFEAIAPINGHEGQTLPMPRRVIAGGIFYTASVAWEGKLVVLTRRLSFRHGSPTCTPADHRAMRPALERIQRDLRDGAVSVPGRRRA